MNIAVDRGGWEGRQRTVLPLGLLCPTPECGPQVCSPGLVSQLAHPGAPGFEEQLGREQERRGEEMHLVWHWCRPWNAGFSGPGVGGSIWWKLQEPGPAWQCLA